MTSESWTIELQSDYIEFDVTNARHVDAEAGYTTVTEAPGAQQRGLEFLYFVRRSL